MIAADAVADRLRRFLAGYDLTPAALTAEVDRSFGPPLLVVATGSVLHGFGNRRSDLDLDIVVDRESLTQLPIMSYTHGARVDTAFYRASDARAWTGLVRDWPRPGRIDWRAWRHQNQALTECVRFGWGLVLEAREDWERWAEEVRGPWLVERVVDWWRIEAIRRRLGSRWLTAANPLLAAHAACQAVLAALERRAAAGGHAYIAPKWLSEKLRLAGDADGLAAFREMLRMPTGAGPAPAYLARSEAILEELLPAEGSDRRLVAQLWYAPGVAVWPLGGRTLVSRWNLRALELSADLPAVGGTEPLWQGPLDALPEPHLLALFREDMTWLSVAARTG